eukprot:2939669-Prymnesium_polylepis.1
MNGIVDGGGGGGGGCGWVVGRPLFVVANVMCGGWLWLSDGGPDSHCFAAVSRGCSKSCVGRNGGSGDFTRHVTSCPISPSCRRVARREATGSDTALALSRARL